MTDGLYRILRAGFQHLIWGGDLRGEENLPDRGPAVLVANHLGALGPIATAAILPLRLYPWIACAMLDPVVAPEYLRLDCVEKEMHLRTPVSRWVADVLSKLAVPLLISVGCIPVFPDQEGLRQTIEISLEHLLQGQFLIVFPEDPNRPIDERFMMTPFKKGFARLGELYYQRCGERLRFYPLAVHAEKRLVVVGDPLTYNPMDTPVEERLRIRNTLEGMIHEMYVSLEIDGTPGLPQIR